MPRRIERGGRALADKGERQDAPERQSAAGHADQNSRYLQEAQRGGWTDARRLEYAPREENQEQADKQGGVGRRTDENERMEPPTRAGRALPKVVREASEREAEVPGKQSPIGKRASLGFTQPNGTLHHSLHQIGEVLCLPHLCRAVVDALGQ